MADERQRNHAKELKAQLAERERQDLMAEMLETANEATDAAEKRKELHLAEMRKYELQKDFKSASRHQKMYLYMDKLSQLSKRYAEMIEDQRAITETYSIMQKMNDSFKKLMSITGPGVTRKAKKNMAKFSKFLGRSDQEIDELMSAMDNMFEEPQKKKRGKKGEPVQETNYEELYYKGLADNKGLSDTYTSTFGDSLSQYSAGSGSSAGSGYGTGSGSGSGSISAPSGGDNSPFGSGIIDIGDPND